ncbi:MAG: hypothetical protein KC493_02650 [Bacteriovoracaceae bacterium]|nr:hypothetical protein [Bacteriovoracaceae bacterium]
MKLFSIIIFLFSMFNFAQAEDCSGAKPLVQPGCEIICKDGAYTQTCENQPCGPKPLANVGCEVGECVSGSWEMKCDCGLKPIPTRGCKIKECKDGVWEEDCTQRKCSAMKPMTTSGCSVECEQGSWVQKCED